MRNRTRMMAAGVAVTAALAAGGGAALASANGTKPSAPAKTGSVSKEPGGAAEAAGHDAIVAAVAGALHVSTARVSAALRPMFAAGHAELGSPSFAAAASSLGVSTQQLQAALVHAKLSLVGGPHGGRAAAAGHDAIAAAVAGALHVSTARASAALRPMFAAGHGELGSPSFAAAARSLGVSTQQLQAALIHAKQSLAG
jgi:hypothetical protein